MKEFIVENGQQVMRINQPDLTCLVCVRKFVPESLFQEDSILKGACDEEGYYKIVELDNVNYLKGVPFIPNHNYLLKLNYSELSQLLKDAIKHYTTTDKMLINACRKYQQLSDTELDFINGVSEVDKKLLERFTSLNPGNFSEWEEMLDISMALKIEFKHHIDCVGEVHRLKYEEDQTRRLNSQDQESSTCEHEEKKSFSVRSFIGSLFK